MSTLTSPSSPSLDHTYISPQEVADLIPGLTVKKLAEWRYERRGPRYRKIGRLILYALDELEDWIEASARLGDGDER
ncbi:helix-turn-helix transcriptional regulator [Microbacterium sp. A196]|uniref:helix-turn-helix transcriptional regulator n=1 Tax=unclassified Microbacterium TaxID=2609290 RepID=UPI003F437A0F